MAKKLKILIYAPDYKPNTGGIAEYIDNIAKNLQNSENHIDLVSYNYTGGLEYDKKVAHNVIRWPNKSDNIFIRYLQQIFLYPFLLSNLIIKSEYDFIILSSMATPFILMAIILLRSKTKWGEILYGLDVNKQRPSYHEILYKKMIKKADVVYTISEYTKEIIEKKYQINKTKIKIITPGISKSFLKENIQKYKPQKFNTIDFKNNKIILSLGRLVERKGFDMLINSMKIIHKEIPDALLLIAGEGPYEQHLIKMVDELKLNNCIKFLGYVNNKEKHYLYSCADVFAMPNRELANGDVEGFGIVFLEANAYGVPVIGGNSGGAPDAIDNNRSGFLVNPLDINEIASKILLLLKNNKLSSKMGLYGKKRNKDFTWKKSANKYNEIIRGLLHKG